MYEIKVTLRIFKKIQAVNGYYFIVRDIKNGMVYYCIIDRIPKKRITKLYIDKLLRVNCLVRAALPHGLRDMLLSSKSIIEYVI